MHREISHVDPAFRKESNLSLYLLTGLIGLLIGIDLWPNLASWLAEQGLPLPTWPQEVSGYRIVLLAAILGGARVLYNSLTSQLTGGPSRSRFGFSSGMRRCHYHSSANGGGGSCVHWHGRGMSRKLHL
jgi:hypothetical protein